MGDTTVYTARIQARVPHELYLLKKPRETQTEFIIRAITALRDGGTDTAEHALLVKMVRVFAKHGIKMDLSKDEVEIVKRLYKE